MHRVERKLFSPVCLVMALLLSFGFPVARPYAAEAQSLTDYTIAAAERQPTLIAGDATVEAGDVAVLDIRIEGNPGIIGATLVVDYDSRLNLTSVKNGEAFQGLDMTKPGELKPGCKIHWDTTEVPEGEVKDGSVLVLTFAVPESAADADEYAVSVYADSRDGQSDVFDGDLTAVDLMPASCKIAVGAAAEPHFHSYGEWSIVKAAGCTEDGSREKVCSGCGDKVTETLAALGHAWNSGAVTKEATADEDGVMTFTCERCGSTRTEAIAATGTTSPSISIGSAEARAGETVAIPVSISGNPGVIGATLELTFDSRLVLKGVANGEAFQALEMTRPGELKSGCRIHWDTTDIADSDIKNGVICTLTFVIPEDASTGDSFSVSLEPVRENGQTDVYDRDVQAVDLNIATGAVSILDDSAPHSHAYGDWVITKDATCTDVGTRERMCSGCGEKDTESIAALGHAWDSGKITKAATYDATGVRTFTCARCGEKRTETIAKLARTSLRGATIDALKSMTYTGKALRPNPTVRIGGKVLVKGADYTVSYKNNTNVGTATVAVTGLGAYQGSMTATFKISAALITEVKLSRASVIYTGKVQKPGIKSVKAGLISLDPSSFSVAYSTAKPIAAGSYTVTVKGTGNFTGVKSVTYKIAKAPNKATAKSTSVKKSLKAKALKRKMQVVALPKATATFGAPKWKVSAKDKKGVLSLSGKNVKVKKGARKGTYAIKLFANVAATKNYAAASTKIVTVKVVVK